MSGHYTSFRLPSGAAVHVLSTLAPPAATARNGTAIASGVGERARETWEDGLELVRELAHGIVGRLQDATASAKDVTVEFGVNISGKSGVILVEGTVAANLKVTIRW